MCTLVYTHAVRTNDILDRRPPFSIEQSPKKCTLGIYYSSPYQMYSWYLNVPKQSLSIEQSPKRCTLLIEQSQYGDGPYSRSPPAPEI